jgi:hypothetical protein
MLVKLLGLLDFITIFLFLIKNYFDKSGWFPHIFLIVAGLYLIIKGAIFILSMDYASIIDIISGVVILFAAYYQIPSLIAMVVIILVGQKAFFSLMD